MCPRCHNAAVTGATSRTWFEFFFVPLIPFSSNHIWICTICQWEMKKGDGPDPQAPGNYPQGMNPYDNRPPPPPQQYPQQQGAGR
ncbi:hypothetical protein DB88DRAFT_195911 [Papiliotrema laurentii]|uniref:Zinc-ribbon 15 domain-containing protein n=1 Tax=Papiliotrema laurentii TaxID=5418 RepID=A0AAD9FSK0_PAPLA|nr:hypothetical protein DB88DRAFT_195911 [Papiliotrema laurentii]